jgi:hypothetical protein
MFQVSTPALTARYDQERSLFLINTKDKNTGELMDDIYWVMEFLYFSPNVSLDESRRGSSPFAGFTSGVREARDSLFF